MLHASCLHRVFEVEAHLRQPREHSRSLDEGVRLMADDNAHSGFVADGYERAREALEPQIRKEVENEYADLCNSSGLLRRWFLQREINMEINRRIAMAAPPDALY